MTVQEIKAFQAAHGLVPDGIIGPFTRKVMRELAKLASKSARKEPDKTAINAKAVFSKPTAVTAPRIVSTHMIPLAATARPINEIIIHCAATPEGRWFDRADVNSWHKQRGWEMIGYHYLVLLDGSIVVGRPIGMIGAHVENHNTGTIGVCYIGGLTRDGKKPKDTRTPEQRIALQWLVSSLKTLHRIKRRAKGHNEYAQKACPSFSVQRDALALI